MSYILDALKKAEADQNPDLRARLELHRQSQRQHSWGLYLIAAALIGNLTVLVWLFGPFTDNTPVATPAASATVPEPSASIAPAEPAPPSAADSPSQLPAARSAIRTEATPAARPDTTQPAAKPATPSPAPVAEPIHTNIAGMSNAARARFPELSFSTHVYAADPALRAVVVNGERLVEGDRLDNLRLTNITETGVVFRFEDYLVSVSVIDDWD